MTTDLPCETCPRMKYELLRCDKLNHPIESGWAMRHHSKTCGESTTKETKQCR
jgi:hypothetical protein